MSAAQPGRLEQSVEVCVFLFLILPSMVLSFFVVNQGSVGFLFVAVSVMLRDLALVSLIFFFVWRNNEPVALIGWVFRNVRREIGLGLLIFIPFVFATGLLESGLRTMGFSAPSRQLPSFLAAKGTAELVVAFVLVVVISVTEEIIFRGYLMLRLKAVTQRPILAAVLSAGVFSLGHGYEGSAGVITVGVMGFIFALVYLWRRSLIAPIVMHFLQDFIGILVLPLIGKG